MLLNTTPKIIKTFQIIQKNVDGNFLLSTITILILF